MKRLILLRHAKSSWDDPKLEDQARPLAARGKRDARRIGQHFSETGVVIDEVLCSTARRARQTWAAVARELSSEPRVRYVDALYLPSLEQFVAALGRARSGSDTVLVVGHSPSIDAFLLTHVELGAARASIADNVPTCALCVVELRGNARALRGKLVRYVTPRELSGERVTRGGPVKGEPVESSEKTRVRELSALAVSSAVDQLRRNVLGAARGYDPEHAHQLRVGIRKLRVFLRLFREQVGRAREERLQTELRWLFQLVGDVRDRDVFEAALSTPRAVRTGGVALRSLRRSVRRARDAAQLVLRRGLDSPRCAALLRHLVALEAELAALRGRSPRVKRWARDRLDKRLHRIHALASATVTLDTTALHALRKQLKKLRYTAELVRGAFSTKHAKRYLRYVSALQDVLGGINDAATSVRLLGQAARSLPKTTRTKATQQVGLRIEQRLESHLAELSPAFDRLVHTKPFWH